MLLDDNISIANGSGSLDRGCGGSLHGQRLGGGITDGSGNGSLSSLGSSGSGLIGVLSRPNGLGQAGNGRGLLGPLGLGLVHVILTRLAPALTGGDRLAGGTGLASGGGPLPALLVALGELFGCQLLVAVALHLGPVGVALDPILVVDAMVAGLLAITTLLALIVRLLVVLSAALGVVGGADLRRHVGVALAVLLAAGGKMILTVARGGRDGCKIRSERERYFQSETRVGALDTQTFASQTSKCPMRKSAT
jgi:hypothetical protein